MNWSDERYVKLYVRKTATWLTWPWEARAVFPSMLKEADGAGLIDVGARDPVRTLAIMLAMPAEVVQPAVDAMLETGTIERTDRGFLITAYIEAQEATKTESRRKQDQRERQRAQVRATTEAGVTRGHEVSRDVPLQPSPAQLTTSSPPAQPSPPPAQRDDQPRRSKKLKGAGQPTLPGVPEALPPPPRAPSRAEVLYARWQEARDLRCVELGIRPTPPDEMRSPAFVNATIGRWLALWPDLGPSCVIEGLTAAEGRVVLLFDAYLEQVWPASCVARVAGKDTATPQPYPFSALASEKVWRKLVLELWPDEEPARGAA